MRIVLIGAKASGKSAKGKKLAEKFNIDFFDTDNVLEELYLKATSEKLSFRQIYQKEGKDYFRNLELEACKSLENRNWAVISTGGSAFLNPDVRNALRKNSIVVCITAEVSELWERILKKGVPAYLENEENPYEAFKKRKEYYEEVVLPFADIITNCTNMTVDESVSDIYEKLIAQLQLKMFSPNSFGDIVRITTFGESHGKALGVVLDGVAAGIEVTEDIIMKELKRRRPGQSSVTTSRKEGDNVKILSGVINGLSTGAPIGMIIENCDQDSSKYDNLKDVFRPGHADFGFFMKFGIRDHRGGGRSSGRETVSRVAAGSVAINELKKRGVFITAYAKKIGNIEANPERYDFDAIEKNSVRCPDMDTATKMHEHIVAVAREGDSTGGVVEVVIDGVKPGLGDPVFFKLDARLAAAFFSIGAVKGVEFGVGFLASGLRGSQNNDPIRDSKFVTNNAGGILGGISTGEKIVAAIAVKPTPSIIKQQLSSNINGDNVDLKIEGRHDPNIVPRIIPVIESMAALVIFDAMLIQESLKGG